MNQIYTFLQSPVGQDAYGTSDLTQLQMGLVMIILGLAFAWLAKKRTQWAKMDK